VQFKCLNKLSIKLVELEVSHYTMKVYVKFNFILRQKTS